MLPAKSIDPNVLLQARLYPDMFSIASPSADCRRFLPEASRPGLPA